MAHFAQTNNENIVGRVIVVDDSQEHRGQEFLADELGLGGTWIQTSYNNNFRKQYAGIGFLYDRIADVFVQPTRYPSWVLKTNHDWEPPTPKPEKSFWVWDEETIGWAEIQPPTASSPPSWKLSDRCY